QHVIAFRQLRRVPNTALDMAVTHGVRHLVKKSCRLTAINRDPALVCIRNLRRFSIGRQSIEKNIDMRPFESRRRCPICFEHLVAQLVQPEPPPISIQVRSIKRIHNDPHWPTHNQPLVLLLLQARAVRVEQLNAILLDRRWNIVFETNRRERKRIDLTARWPNVHVNVIHLINRADSVAGPKTRATSDSNSLQLPFSVMHWNESRIVKHLCVFIASDVQMNVRHDANTKALVERIEPPICLRADNFLRTHRTNRLAVSTEDIEPAV